MKNLHDTKKYMIFLISNSGFRNDIFISIFHMKQTKAKRDFRMFQFVSESCVLVSHIGVNCGLDPLVECLLPGC